VSCTVLSKREILLAVTFLIIGALVSSIAVYGFMAAEISSLKSEIEELEKYAPPKERPIAVITAFPGELDLIVKEMNKTGKVEVIKIGSWTFFYGTLYGKKVVAFFSGIGKTNAAAGTELCIARFNPKAIIFTGIAGGVPEFADIGDITISTAVAHHDYGRVIPPGGLPGVEYPETADLIRGFVPRGVPIFKDGKKLRIVFFNASTELVDLALKAAKEIDFGVVPGTNRTPVVRTGIIVTGDQFIASTQKCEWLYKVFNALATEMEGASVAQVAYMHNIPWVIIRCHSDRADDIAEKIIKEFWRYAAVNAAKLTLKMVELWPESM